MIITAEQIKEAYGRGIRAPLLDLTLPSQRMGIAIIIASKTLGKKNNHLSAQQVLDGNVEVLLK